MMFSINKLSVILDARLIEWIYIVDEKRFHDNPYLLKYVLTKYLNIEASERVIAAILDVNISSKQILTEIQKHMSSIIESNKKNKRMKDQVTDYKKIVKLIKRTKHFADSKVNSINFDWYKVYYALSLWLDEYKMKDLDQTEITLVLDEGIPKKHFVNLELDEIIECAKSHQYVGIRVSDLLIALAGNYIIKLRKNSSYNPNEPNKVSRLSMDWFQMTEVQFNLILLMNEYYFNLQGQYSFVVDTYFDQELSFESYIRYVASFASFEHFNKINPKLHVSEQFQFLFKKAEERWSLSMPTIDCIRSSFGSVRRAVISGIFRPI